MAWGELAADPSAHASALFLQLTLAQLLERHGFTIAYAGHDGMYRSVDTMAYILLNIKRSRPGIYRALKRSGVLNRNLYLNLDDIVDMIATRSRRSARADVWQHTSWVPPSHNP